MPDFLAQKRAELENRLRELRPLHDEYVRLERAMRAFGNTGSQPAATASPRAASTNGRRRRSASTNGRRRRAASTNGRRRRSANGRRRASRGGTRAEQALTVVRQNPGITVSELGDKLGITQKNYLYRVMNNLQADGAVRKRGRGFSAA